MSEIRGSSADQTEHENGRCWRIDRSGFSLLMQIKAAFDEATQVENLLGTCLNIIYISVLAHMEL